MEPSVSGSSWDDFVGSALLSAWTEPLVSMPWEQGFAGMVLGGKGLGMPEALARPGPPPPLIATEVARDADSKVVVFWDKVAVQGSPIGLGSAFFIVAKRGAKEKGWGGVNRKP